MALGKICIPVYRPALGREEWRNVRDCLSSSWISSKGRFLNTFESRFARRVGKKHAVAMSNGTTALHAALLAIGLRAGDEVIVPTFSYIAPINAIRYTGARPIFVDSNPQTWQMDPQQVAAVVGKKTKAILAVHLYGHVCKLDALRNISRRAKIHLVEDCAEALGSTYRGQPVGFHAAVSTYSFFGNKTITTGEGGMVTTDQDARARILRSLRGQGLAPGREYWHDRIGFNYRMTNICAAIGTAQLSKLHKFLAEKRRLNLFYESGLRGLPVQFQIAEPHGKSSYWMISILCRNRAERDGLRSWLRQKGIETRPLFQPVHLMPMYKPGLVREFFPVAEHLAACGMNLPSHPSLSPRERALVVSSIRTFFQSRCSLQ